MVSFRCGIKKNDTKQQYLQNRERLTDIENKHGYQGGKRGGGGQIRGMGLTDTNYYM